MNLFYLTPDYRERGLGEQLERYAVDYLRSAGFSRAWLRVSAANTRAIRFYQKHGWIDCGPDPREPDTHVMRKSLA